MTDFVMLLKKRAVPIDDVSNIGDIMTILTHKNIVHGAIGPVSPSLNSSSNFWTYGWAAGTWSPNASTHTAAQDTDGVYIAKGTSTTVGSNATLNPQSFKNCCSAKIATGYYFHMRCKIKIPNITNMFFSLMWATNTLNNVLHPGEGRKFPNAADSGYGILLDTDVGTKVRTVRKNSTMSISSDIIYETSQTYTSDLHIVDILVNSTIAKVFWDGVLIDTQTDHLPVVGDQLVPVIDIRTLDTDTPNAARTWRLYQNQDFFFVKGDPNDFFY